MHRGLHELSSRATEAYEGARTTVAKYLGADDGVQAVADSRARNEGVEIKT